MTEMMSGVDKPDDAVAADAADGVDEQLISRLAGRARAGGLQLTGEGGVLQQLTKLLLEAALDGEMTDHLGMTSVTRPGAMAGTPATGRVPRRC
jgi:hypothetical protein